MCEQSERCYKPQTIMLYRCSAQTSPTGHSSFNPRRSSVERKLAGTGGVKRGNATMRNVTKGEGSLSKCRNLPQCHSKRPHVRVQVEDKIFDGLRCLQH